MRFRRSPFVATFALAAFVATLALPFIAPRHGLGDDVDFAWGDERVGSGHPVTQVEPVYPAVASDHCAICHWAREFSSSVHGTAVRYVLPISIGASASLSFDAAATVALTAGPPRGPPIAL